MDIGICVPSHIGDIGYIVRAEEQGYSHAWCADSQMLWSDCYAVLALVADKTSRIKIGTGVAITGTRPPAVNAAGIATINAIAPGRTFFGVGAGNTAMRVMGQPPQKIAQFGRYLREIKPLLTGDESNIHFDNQNIPIRHIMPDKGFVNFEDKIPMYVSGFGPKSLALAGKYGDGAVIGTPSSGASMENVWLKLEAGARDAGREINRQEYYMTSLAAMIVLDDGEAVDSERVKYHCGAMVMASVHFSYDQWRNFGFQPPGHMAEIWDDYTALLESVPEKQRHQRIHAGHNCWVVPEEEKFLTKALIERTCMVGTQEDLVERLREFETSGLNQIMNLPSFDPRFEVLERVAKDVIPYV